MNAEELAQMFIEEARALRELDIAREKLSHWSKEQIRCRTLCRKLTFQREAAERELDAGTVHEARNLCMVLMNGEALKERVQ